MIFYNTFKKYQFIIFLNFAYAKLIISHMSKLKELFSMSKQERTGAWAILILIVVLLAVVVVEKRCSNDNIDPSAQKQMNEYIEKTKDVKVKESKTKKSKSAKVAKKSSKSTKSQSKATGKTTKRDNKKSNKKTGKSTSNKNGTKSRKIEPVPQF